MSGGGKLPKVSDKYIVKIRIPRKINRRVVVPTDLENSVIDSYNLEIRCKWYYIVFYGMILAIIFGGLLFCYLYSLEDESNDSLNITETNITDTLTGLTGLTGLTELGLN